MFLNQVFCFRNVDAFLSDNSSLVRIHLTILMLCLQSLGSGKFDDLDGALPDDEDIDIVNDETFGAGAVCEYSHPDGWLMEPSSYRQSRRDEIILCRSRIGHTFRDA